jgi:hypothetical protein
MCRRYLATGEQFTYGQKGKRYGKLNSFTGKGAGILMRLNFLKAWALSLSIGVNFEVQE